MTEFDATINREDLRSILNSVTVIVEECRVLLDDDRVRIRGTDPAGVALVVVEVSEDVFSSSEIGDGSVYWDFDEMADMVETGEKAEEVHLKLQETDLDIELVDLSFTLSLLDPESLKRDQEKPELDLEGEVVLDGAPFKRGVEAADLVADHVEFGIDDEESSFYMMAKGDTNEVIMEKKKKDLETMSMDPVSSTYSVEYMKDVCDSIPDDGKINIGIDQDFPTEISFDIVGGDASVTYFISPRIGDD